MKQAKPDYREAAPTSNEPDVEDLREEFLWALNQRDSSIFRRQRLNYNTRYCIWANQTSDGRKWAASKGQDIFPWPGASDARVSLVDMYCNEDVAKLMVVWRRMRVLVNGTESNDAAFAIRLTQLLRWMKYTQMTESPHEMRLLANIFLERGTAILGVFWERQRQLGYETLDRETLIGMGMEAAQTGQVPEGLNVDPIALAVLPKLLMDPTRDKISSSILGSLYPDVAAKRLGKVVTDLRTSGQARFPRAYLLKDRPCLVALAPNEDVFTPPETTDLQKARAIHRRELLTETDLRDRITTNNWDADWVEEVIETQRGRITPDFEGNIASVTMWRGQQNGRGVLNTARMYEVIHSYRRLHDAEGVPGIYYDCWSMGIPSGVAWHTLLDYDHGQQPFVHFSREVRSRLLDDSRGYGEIASTWQQQMKTEWDSRIDRASIATLPPSYHPPGEAPDAWGPGVKIGTMRPDDYGFMKKPEYDIGSKEAEMSVKAFAARYFARVVAEEGNQVEAQIQQQDLAEIWMNHCGEADMQILQLMQQYMPDTFYYRVVGSTKAKPLHASREEIQGKFDVSITYNVGMFNQEHVQSTMELIKEFLQMDTTGRIDRDELLVVVAEMLDPNLGERVIKPGEEGAMAEVKDEKLTYAMMYSGLPVDVIPGNAQAYQLRLNTLTNIMQTNLEAKKKYQTDPQFKFNIDKRLKQLGFQLQERENAKIGALGA